MKYIKSNIGFIIAMIVLVAIALNPQLKGLVLQGLMRTGLYKPAIDNNQANIADFNSKLAPSAIFQSSSGEKINISASKGKVIFLNFWATWCPPCVAEMPSIQSLKQKLANKEVLFVMVDVDNDLRASQTFMKKHKYDLPVYSHVSNIPKNLFKGSLPTTVIINKLGEIVFYHEGMANYNSKEMEDFMNKLSN